MRLAHIHIENFRNFHTLDIAVGRSVVVLGENQIGKTNLLYALRLVLDPSLPDSARQLRTEDFWDGITRPLSKDARIRISIDIADFENDEGQLAVLAEHLVQPEPMVARLSYEFGPISGLANPPIKDGDFEFSTFGGGRPENRIGYDVRKRIPMEVLHALRDAEGDLARWTKSPLKPLIDRAKSDVEQADLQTLADGVSKATEKVAELKPISDLETRINDKLKGMAGTSQAIETALGFSPADPNKLLRALRLLFDGKRRDVSEASLGTANVLYLALRSLDLDSLVAERSREHTFFSIEEPEAHLHPHLQRLVYRSYLRVRQPTGLEVEEEPSAVTYLLTTHSAHIASVTPVESLILLRKDDKEDATVGVSGAAIQLTEAERDDIERYLDVSRAEGLFSRGILLVEGDAERFLVPVLAARAGYDLDALGIAVCSVGGTNFVPYVKFFGPIGLNLPIAVLTDYDPTGGGKSLGEDRVADQVVPAILGEATPKKRSDRLAVAESEGIFLNNYTFEVDLVRCGYFHSVARTMEELCSVKIAVERAKKRAESKTLDDVETFLGDIGYVGKGRFAQRLAAHVTGSKCKRCPDYIVKAIKQSSNELTANYSTAAEDLRRNERQWTAYESRGHCVVLAGPGSGKTKVLTTKMARMLAEDVRSPRGIACITFNNQCVKELRKRLGKLGIEEGSRAFIGTVHSFCLREVVVPYAKLAGLDMPDPLKVAPPTEQDRLFAEAVQAVIGNENPQYVRTPFDEFRRTVLDRISPEWTGNERYAPLVAKYESLLKGAGKIDFDGMALAGLALIKAHAWVRKALRAKYPILVVDEYQDLGIPLHEMVVHLCFEGGIRLFAVGDPDQSIYGFTGARPALMNDLANRDDVEDVRLRLNYRCGKTIIVASTTALAETRDFEPAEEHRGVVQDYQCQNGFGEQVKLAVETIVPESLSRRKGRKLGDVGILYLNQYDGGSIAEAVEAAGIEYVRFDQGNPYQRTPVISWLEDCAVWCAGGWKVGEPKLSALLQAWLRFNPSLSKESEIMACRRDLVRFLFGSRSQHVRLLDWLNEFDKEGLYVRIKNDVTMADEAEALKALHESSKDGNPLAACTVANFGGQRGSPDRLNLTTIHSAKGLEYDVVVMMGLDQGLLPDYRAASSTERLREERRKFYVAMTRARHEVHLLWTGWYERSGRVFRNGRSQFVDEIMSRLQDSGG